MSIVPIPFDFHDYRNALGKLVDIDVQVHLFLDPERQAKGSYTITSFVIQTKSHPDVCISTRTVCIRSVHFDSSNALPFKAF